MTGSWLELAIIGFIIAGIAFVIFRGGQANPETTGKLHRRLVGVESAVAGLTTRVGDMEKKSATSADVKRLEGMLRDAETSRHEAAQFLHKQAEEIAQLRESVAAQTASSNHTAQQVDRLYDHIVSKGMNS